MILCLPLVIRIVFLEHSFMFTFPNVYRRYLEDVKGPYINDGYRNTQEQRISL